MNDEEMVKTYSDMIYGVAMRYVRNRADADDVYSDVFYRYFLRERKFDSEELNDDMFGDEPVSASWDTSIEDILAVREALKQLDGDYREVIELYYFNGLSTAEISQTLQRSVNTVKSQLLRGRERLKVLLSGS